MKKKELAKEGTLVVDEINDVETFFLLRKNDKANDFLYEAIMMYELLAGNLCQNNLQEKM